MGSDLDSTEHELNRPDGPARLFISYRRADSGGHTGRIRDRLRQRYGPKGVFQDVDTIEAGEDFIQAIEQGLDQCDVQLVVIGPDWLTIADGSGARRLDNPSDPLVVEIATGLNRPDLRVIPVLVGGARMPRADELPPNLSDLAVRNAVELRDSRWEDDLDQLVDQIGGRPYRVGGLPVLAWVALALGTLVIGGAALLWPSGPDLMDGQFRIAVGQFTADDERLNDQADQLSDTVFRGLDSELAELNNQGFDFQVREPDRTGPIRNAEEAAQVADDIDADVVVYATLTADGLEPEFYLRQRQAATLSGEPHFAGAEELTGQHALGSKILASSIDVGGIGPAREVVTALSSRTGALVQFVIGLSYYVAEPPDYGMAQQHFESAVAGSGWPDEDGKEVLYLFLGNVAVGLGDLEAASTNYLKAVDVSEGGYARAHIGVADVTFRLARGDCQPNSVSPAGLKAALLGFERARSIGGGPVSDIDVKSALGVGKVKRCISQAQLEDLWDEAEVELKSVISAFDDGNDRVTTLAAEAHAELALLLSPSSPDAPDATAAYEAAIAETEQAIALITSERRKASFYARLGYYYERLGRDEESEAAYQTAAELVADSSDGAELAAASRPETQADGDAQPSSTGSGQDDPPARPVPGREPPDEGDPLADLAWGWDERALAAPTVWDEYYCTSGDYTEQQVAEIYGPDACAGYLTSFRPVDQPQFSPNQTSGDSITSTTSSDSPGSTASSIETNNGTTTDPSQTTTTEPTSTSTTDDGTTSTTGPSDTTTTVTEPTTTSTSSVGTSTTGSTTTTSTETSTSTESSTTTSTTAPTTTTSTSTTTSTGAGELS